MGHVGFSYIGLIFIVMLIVPNLIWTQHQPRGYTADNENKILLLFERVGQVLVTGAAILFSDYNLKPWTAWSWWLVLAAVLMILYELNWLRYFRNEKTMESFYASFCGFPVAGASLPIAAFFCLGIYGRVIWLILAVFILGIGHIGIHWQHRQDLSKKS